MGMPILRRNERRKEGWSMPTRPLPVLSTGVAAVLSMGPVAVL
jgi:hypothetical protein